MLYAAFALAILAFSLIAFHSFKETSPSALTCSLTSVAGIGLSLIASQAQRTNTFETVITAIFLSASLLGSIFLMQMHLSPKMQPKAIRVEDRETY